MGGCSADPSSFWIPASTLGFQRRKVMTARGMTKPESEESCDLSPWQATYVWSTLQHETLHKTWEEAIWAWPFWEPNKYNWFFIHKQTCIWVHSAHPNSISSPMFPHWGCTFSAELAWLRTIQVSLAGMKPTQQGSNVWVICVYHQPCLATHAVMLQQIL